MDHYKCENCGKVFDEFEMNYRAAQIDKKCWCRACREAAQQSVQPTAFMHFLCDICGTAVEVNPDNLAAGPPPCTGCGTVIDLRHSVRILSSTAPDAGEDRNERNGL